MTDTPAAAATPAADIAQLGFEQAQAELESVVEQLEDSHTGLDAAIALWERGEALHAHCRAKLDYAAERIRRIQLSPDEIVAAAGAGADEDFTPRADAPPAADGGVDGAPSMF